MIRLSTPPLRAPAPPKAKELLPLPDRQDPHGGAAIVYAAITDYRQWKWPQSPRPVRRQIVKTHTAAQLLTARTLWVGGIPEALTAR